MQGVPAGSAAHRPVTGVQREGVGRVGYREGILLDPVLERSGVQIRDGDVPEIYWYRRDIQELERRVLEPVATRVSGRVDSPEMPGEVPPFPRRQVRRL